MNKTKDRMISFFELGINSRENVTIDQRKISNKMMYEIRNSIKGDKCFYCNASTTSFCNSHSIPSFVLKNIAENGQLLNLNSFLKIPISDEISGLRKSGTFEIICKNCDNNIFKDYESPDLYSILESPTQKMLSQIALKIYLSAIYKALFGLEFYKQTALEPNVSAINYQIAKLDYNEYCEGYRRAKSNLEKNWDDYFLIYFKKLDYTVPIAFQDKITLINGLNDEVINDVYNTNPNYHTKDLNICVFPLKSSTVIMMFIHNKDRSRYSKFYKEFNKKTDENKLEIINFLIFSYSENVYISPYVTNDILKNEDLIEASRLSGRNIVGTNDKDKVNFMDLLVKKYSYEISKRLPNFLLMDISKIK